eukprot:SAG31_NODE_168_length_21484_cov_21.524994_13_plen_82_part_00
MHEFAILSEKVRSEPSGTETAAEKTTAVVEKIQSLPGSATSQPSLPALVAHGTGVTGSDPSSLPAQTPEQKQIHLLMGNCE